MKKVFYLILILPILLSIGCGHTNNLSKYSVDGKTIMFTDVVASGARKIKIVTQESYGKKDATDILSVIASVGSEILNADSRSKLESAVDPKLLVGYVSAGLEDALVKYLDIEAVSSLRDNPDFLVETVLDACSLIVSPNGVSVYVKANARIIDRASGELVWENWESRTIPVERHYTTGQESKTLERVFNAAQLAALSPAEVNEVVGMAADDVGYFMAETLREDIIKSRKQK